MNLYATLNYVQPIQPRQVNTMCDIDYASFVNLYYSYIFALICLTCELYSNYFIQPHMFSPTIYLVDTLLFIHVSGDSV